jgi:hypothetical protein
MLGVFSNVRRWIGPSASSADEAGAGAGPESVTFPATGEEGATRFARPEVLCVILRMVLRDVRLRAGMDKDWLGLEVMDAAPGLQARLVLKFWAPNVPACAAQLERLFIERLCEVDAEALRWFRGLSWRLEPQAPSLARLPESWPGAALTLVRH